MGVLEKAHWFPLTLPINILFLKYFLKDGFPYESCISVLAKVGEVFGVERERKHREE